VTILPFVMVQALYAIGPRFSTSEKRVDRGAKGVIVRG